MASAPRRLSDQQLRTADLLVDDPLTVDCLTHDPPDTSFAPVIIAEYHLPSDQMVRCSHCEQRQHHQHGFVAEFAPGRRHLIGSECGTARLGMQFASARTGHRELLDRQGYVRRLDLIGEQCEALVEQCNAILGSEALRAIEEAGTELARLAGDAVIRLRASDGLLQEEVKVRDHEAESRRPETQKHEIYRIERRAIGQLRGRALLRSDGLRQRIFAFKKEVREVAALGRQKTDQLTTASLRKAFKALDERYEDATAAIDEMNRAPAFFSPANVALLARWAQSGTASRIQDDAGRLRIAGTEMRPLRPISLVSLGAIR